MLKLIHIDFSLDVYVIPILAKCFLLLFVVKIWEIFFNHKLGSCLCGNYAFLIYNMKLSNSTENGMKFKFHVHTHFTCSREFFVVLFILEMKFGVFRFLGGFSFAENFFSLCVMNFENFFHLYVNAMNDEKMGFTWKIIDFLTKFSRKGFKMSTFVSFKISFFVLLDAHMLWNIFKSTQQFLFCVVCRESQVRFFYSILSYLTIWSSYARACQIYHDDRD